MRTINPNILKALAIISNVFVVLGFVLLIMMKLVLAITMFAVAITISLMMFNVLFRDRTGMKIIVNISFVIVIGVIILAYFLLK
ncbi:hypothetical protein [Staphylococcus carnosus]|uniref:Uncharacterized protein n=1 Tax=Staphylococcus carnosus (strain TM300) TaxID=396513 RepID=B9DLU7_STACT|nr:hypothetical protein [Staphylococcus carnosus]POA07976.1 hypothetical protein CD153_00605 [Staphylococcus carnosus]QPT04793.1 hypothetical protein I6G40_05030 [Staphylococcus carnosus]QQS84587.1 hypothetical protein I6J04_09315 [Staphylococcus carnosus]QRQ04527.1 hypothetical protein I6J34_09710 [Staphylococcus carnosus]UQA67518.1 hypothetical protein Sta3580_01060 [Staphylococcus carnosus]